MNTGRLVAFGALGWSWSWNSWGVGGGEGLGEVFIVDVIFSGSPGCRRFFRLGCG